MIRKIGGNWHKIDIWEKANCIVGYKSKGLTFVSLASMKELRYIPFYNFRDFIITDNGVVVTDNNNNKFKLEKLYSRFVDYMYNISFPLEKTIDIRDFNIIDDVRAVDVSANMVIVAYKRKGVDFFDKKSKEKIVHFDFPGYSFVDDIKFYKNKLYIADVFGLRIIDVLNISFPVLDDSNIIKGWPKDVAIKDHYIFVADVLGVKIFDKDDRFKLVGKFETNQNRIAKIIINNNCAFLSCEARGLRILDISNVKSPKLIGGILLPKGAWDITQYNNYLFIASYTSGLFKIDFSNIKSLITVAKFDNGKEIIGVYVNEQYVIALASYFGVIILNHKLEFIQQIRIEKGRCWSAIEFNKYLFIGCGKKGVVIYDITNINKPLFVTELQTKEARDLVIDGSLLYVADGENGVEIFNISNISCPQYIRNIPSAAFTRGVIVDSNFIYKADGDGGLEIYKK